MLDFLGKILGVIMKAIYDFLLSAGSEPKNFSFFAMSIILSTIFIKLITLPLQLRSSKQMKKTQSLQPQVKEIQLKYKHDPQEVQRRIAMLYRENGASMTGGCLPLLVTLPVLFAFFRVMQSPDVYVFKEVGHFESISKTFFWIKDLTLPDPYWYGLPLLVGVATYLQTLTTPKVANDPQAEQMQSSMKMMNYFMPIMLFYFALRYPGGLALYWVTSTLFTAVQSLISNRSLIFKKKGE